MVIQLET